MTTEEAYRLYFRKLSGFVEFLRLIINEYHDTIPLPPPELTEERKKFLRLFDSKKAKSLCGSCGQCCYQGGSPLTTLHLIRLYLESPSFPLPQPEYEFLNTDTYQQCGYGEKRKRNFRSDGYKCIFLGKNGCRLKENRPRICYNFTCGTLWNLLPKPLRLIDSLKEKAGLPDLYWKWGSDMQNAFKKVVAQTQKRIADPQDSLLKDFSQEELRQFLLAIKLFIYPPGDWSKTSLALGFDSDNLSPAYLNSTLSQYGDHNAWLSDFERWVSRCEEKEIEHQPR